MTSLESLVPSLNLCQQLRTAGFPQHTVLMWALVPQGHIIAGASNTLPDGPVIQVPSYTPGGFKEEVVEARYLDMMPLTRWLCAAPTAEEILRVLPNLLWIGDSLAGLQSWVSTSCDFAFYVGWQRHHPHGEKEDPWYGADKESEAAARAVLWWKEQK